jgi:uncharacterized protein (UPF0332 family)
VARRAFKGRSQDEHRCRIYLALDWSGFDWTEFLRLAEELADREDAAAQRSAVSRAYYSVYCVARDALEIRGLFDRREAESHHQEVWDAFEGDSRREWKRIGLFGHSLRENRRQADYDEQVPNLPRFTEGAMRQARRLNADLQSL